ncbi:MAG TPA: MmgE/PrpD family protein [Burkholderiales bacterium]|nr:MmgE/PrpD family protein [Burkholderiales bacterium]
MDATIERIATYAHGLTFESLTTKAVHEAKRRLIDALGCGLGGYDDEPCRIARKLASRASVEGGARILGTAHRTLPELAAFANGVLVRYLDGNDTLPGGGGHPSDVMAPTLAVGESVRADGRELITSMALAYEVYYAFFRGACMRDRGMDHVLYTAVASAVGAGKLLGLDPVKLGHAVALAVTPNIALHATRRGDLSMWKGVAAGNAARNGVFAALLAAEGMSGPANAIEGSHGLRELTGTFELGELAPAGGDFKVAQSNLKFFLSEYHSQNPITLALQLSRDVEVEDIESVTIHTYWFAWHEIGSEPEKWHPTTRESADHSLPFIVSAVLIDGAFSDAIFSAERIRDARVHALADKVSVQEDPAFTKRFSAEIPCRVEIRTRRGEVKTASADFPRGHFRNPMTDDEVESKFRMLAGRYLPTERVDAALKTLWALERMKDCGLVLDALEKR